MKCHPSNRAIGTAQREPAHLKRRSRYGRHAQEAIDVLPTTLGHASVNRRRITERGLTALIDVGRGV
jgi:hypothetical protein